MGLFLLPIVRSLASLALRCAQPAMIRVRCHCEPPGIVVDCPLDFGPYLLASQDRGMTRSFVDQINIAERFGVEDAPAPVRLF